MAKWPQNLQDGYCCPQTDTRRKAENKTTKMANSVQQCLARAARGLPVIDGLDEYRQFFASPGLAPAVVIETDGKAIVLDLTASGRLLRDEPPGISVERLGELIDAEMQRAGTGFAFGRYGEQRGLYDNDNFADKASSERRTIHMGIDLFCAAGTPVHSPLDAQVQIIANNTAELDYGPMLVLKHSAGRREFFSLYGHLELDSIAGLQTGQAVSAGQAIARVGSPPENGNWPPHLHFQLILDLLWLNKDFPGVAYPSQRDVWLTLSPSPAVFFPECDATLLQAADEE